MIDLYREVSLLFSRSQGLVDLRPTTKRTDEYDRTRLPLPHVREEGSGDIQGAKDVRTETIVVRQEGNAKWIGHT